MSQLKRLAGQTAIYGLSSILGRLINYALVPLHTSVFLPDQLGIVTALYAYTALLMIVYTFGMETAYFRFANTDSVKAYLSSSTVIVFISSIVTLLLYFYAEPLAILISYPDTSVYIQWLAIILWIDAISAIPFARLRQENKAKKFALLKILSIVFNIGIQVVYFLILPLFEPQIDISIETIFMANLMANGIVLLFLLPELKDFRFVFDFKSLKPYLVYSFPIFLMGLAGMANEQLDKILLEHLLPFDFYANLTSTEALGVYGQTFKLGVFMMLAIQAFRYAGEPFFFANATDKKAPELFAQVMHYFVIAGLLLFVLVSINVDLIAQVFLRRPEYRTALYLVPIILFGKLIYGIYVNLSIWFKITDRTQFGTYFSIVGLSITILANWLLIPLYGMIGAALTSFCCYLVMSVVCLYYGQKHFRIPYNFYKLLPYFIFSILIVYLSFIFQLDNLVFDFLLRGIFSLLIVALVFFIEKRHLERLKT